LVFESAAPDIRNGKFVFRTTMSNIGREKFLFRSAAPNIISRKLLLRSPTPDIRRGKLLFKGSTLDIISRKFLFRAAMPDIRRGKFLFVSATSGIRRENLVILFTKMMMVLFTGNLQKLRAAHCKEQVYFKKLFK